ncbi:HAAS signaling domain-containing protein [Kitasatospora sp. NPDC059827]|uniref:HAAS signaling domain-containing protein n=1 Tax=Kitasatospora sp. NPDC059827 TaxID=3346964 RepID=UPI003655DF8B
MNNPVDHPLVRAHLDAVTRGTATLPPERRRELLADLREHIEVSLTDVPLDDDAVRSVLAQLGTPRQIADAALAEEGQTPPAPETTRWTNVTLALAVLALPVSLVPVAGPVLGFAAAVVAAVRVTRSRQWTRREKRQAAVLMVSPLLLVPAIMLAFTLFSTGLTASALLVACALGFSPSPIAALRLSRAAARVRTADLPA